MATLAGLLVSVRVARNVVTPPRHRVYDIAILTVNPDASTVRLARTADTVVPGRYSLWFDDDRGHARVGEIVHSDEHSVTRRLHGVQRGDLTRATRARWAGWWYLTPDDLDVRWRDVGISTPLGIAPAWLIESNDDAAQPSADWVLIVHGRGVTRAEGLRAVAVFSAAGYRSLLVSYRNDGDAPPSIDGRYALGNEEWRDVEAAIHYARHEGARRIVLMGWSMGGATVLQCMMSSSLADHIDGLVLESPVVDWIPVLHFQARAAGMPAPIRDTALAMLASGWASRWVGLDDPINFTRLDIVARAAELSIPLLILHSDDDGFVPIAPCAALAATRPDLVRLERFSTARHTKLWNYDARRWERAISTWLSDALPIDSDTSSGRAR